jgi:hypothetical protein
LDLDTSYLFWVPPLIVAAATLYVFYRAQVVRLTELQLSQFYGPLYLYVVRGMPVEGEFWRLLSPDEQKDFITIMRSGNHLGSDTLHEIILGGAFSSLTDVFAEQKDRIWFQEQFLRDYEKLREDYTNAKHWFLPKQLWRILLLE